MSPRCVFLVYISPYQFPGNTVSVSASEISALVPIFPGGALLFFREKRAIRRLHDNAKRAAQQGEGIT
jgi:hypothetical protein